MARRIDSRLKDLIIKYAEAVNYLLDLNEIYIFGSYANGDYNEDSDIDVAFFIPDKEIKDRFFTEVELMKRRRSFDLRIEPHIVTSDEVGSDFATSIIKSGIKIFG